MYLTRWSCRSAAGDTADTLAALRAGTARPGCFQTPLRELLCELLDDLGPPPDCDLLLLGTGKGDCPLWLTGLAEDRPGPGGPAWLAAELGQHCGCPAYAVSAACASGSAALAEAGRLLASGHHRRILVVAGDRLAPFIEAGFTALRAIDPSGCHPFDRDRAGLALGESTAAVVVQRDGPGIPLAGWGMAADAVHLTAPCRQGSGLARAIRAACQTQRPAWVCAHGTGTPFNDASEAAALSATGCTAPVTAWKGGLGHSLGACGLTEAALIAECLQSGAAIPGIAGLRRPDPDLAIAALLPGSHRLPDGPVLSTNAGFGGLDVALLIGGPAPAAAVDRPHAQLAGELVLDHRGWRGRRGSQVLEGDWQVPAPPGSLPAPGAREILGRGDAAWSRMDGDCRILVAALVHFGSVLPGSALLLLDDRSGAASDHRFEADRLAGRVDPRRFPYTLNTAAVGEACIRAGLTGPAACHAGMTADQCEASITALLADGAPAVLVAERQPDHLLLQQWIPA